MVEHIHLSCSTVITGDRANGTSIPTLLKTNTWQINLILKKMARMSSLICLNS